MKIIQTEIEGLKVVQLDLWKDNRGYFTERFQMEKFKQAELPYQFVQDNHSRSIPKVLRGIHFQKDPDQGKLVGVIRGKIWDVAIDLRKNSPTFKKSFHIELSDENGLLLWIPGGFGHGFCVLGNESADVMYKVDQLYNPKTENGIRWSDPDLKIPWPIHDPIVSEKDQKLMSFQDYLARY